MYKMGPRPLFCTPCRAVRLSDAAVGVLMPMQGVVVDPETVPAEEAASAEGGNAAAAYHPGVTPSDYASHPLRRLYSAKTDSFLCWDPEQDKCVPVMHEWVERNVIPMCSQVLVKAWSPCMQTLVQHISYKGLQRARGADVSEILLQTMRDNNVYIMATIVPPRDTNDYAIKVWVSFEVRHTFGNLKNMPFADMITIAIPPSDLRPMVEASSYNIKPCGASSSTYTSKKRRRAVGGSHHKRKAGVGEDTATAANSDDNEGGGDHQTNTGGVLLQHEDRGGGGETDDMADLIISNYIYATQV